MNQIDTSVASSSERDKTKSPLDNTVLDLGEDNVPQRKQARSDTDSLQNEIETVMRNISNVAR